MTLGGAVSLASVRLAMVANEVDDIDKTILRIDREIARQNQRKRELLARRADIERMISTPISLRA